MNNFLSGIAVTFSFIALAGSGFAVFRVSQLESSPPIASVSSLVAPPVAVETASSSEAIPEPIAEEADLSEFSSRGTEIEPEQFSQTALDGQARVEITAAKRLKTSEGF